MSTRPITRMEALYAVLTPIWDKDMGHRLAMMRMKLGWDQAELGRQLGVSASTISDLELGRLVVPRAPFSFAKLMEVMPKMASHVVLGTGNYADSYNAIRVRYWREKLRRKEKSAAS